MNSKYRLKALIVAAVSFTPSPYLGALAQTSTENPILIGAICFAGPETRIPQVIAILKNAGSTVKRDPKRDAHCYDDGHPLSLDVPEGLESWSVETIMKAGISADFATGTAGGSGDQRLMFDPNRLLTQAITPQSLQSVRSDIQCRLNSTFGEHFESTTFSPCRQTELNDGLCWEIAVAGHTKVSTGFNSASLGGKLSDKYWFRSKLEIWMGFFPRYVDLLGNDLGPKVKVHISVHSSRFARFPPNAKPEPNEFHAIDHFNPIASPDDVDDALNLRAVSLLEKSSLRCKG